MYQDTFDSNVQNLENPGVQTFLTWGSYGPTEALLTY